MQVVLYGACLTWTSPVLSKISNGEPFYMSPEEISWMVSIAFIGNLLSPVPAGKLMDALGRKKTMLISTALLTAAWILLLLAEDKTVVNIARFLTGLNNGITLVVLPTYCAEISEPKVRGSVTTVGMLAFMIGMFFEYFLGPILSYRLLNLANLILPVTTLILLTSIPETPHWFSMKDRRVEALASLAWLRNKYDNEVEDELSTIEKENMKQNTNFKELLQTKGSRRAIRTVVVVGFCNRMSGFLSMMAYASTSLPDLGWATPNECVSMLGVVSFIASVISIPLVEKVRRRPLLIGTTFACAVSMFSSAVWYYLNTNTVIDVKKFNWVPAVSIGVLAFFFCIGLGPLAIIFQGEYFPTSIRASSSAIASFTFALSGFLANYIWKYVEIYIGIYFNYLIFTIINSFCSLYAVFFVIETKGKTLLEIQNLLKR